MIKLSIPSLSNCASQKGKLGGNTFPFLVNLSLLTVGLFFLVTQGRNPPIIQRLMYHRMQLAVIFPLLSMFGGPAWLAFIFFQFPISSPGRRYIKSEALKLLILSVLRSWLRIHKAGCPHFSVVLGDSKHCWTSIWLVLKKQEGLS